MGVRAFIYFLYTRFQGYFRDMLVTCLFAESGCVFQLICSFHLMYSSNSIILWSPYYLVNCFAFRLNLLNSFGVH